VRRTFRRNRNCLRRTPFCASSSKAAQGRRVPRQGHELSALRPRRSVVPLKFQSVGFPTSSEKEYSRTKGDFMHHMRTYIGVGVLGIVSACALFAADTSAGLRAFQEGDYKTALREFKTGAEQGQANAQYNLAVLYLQGLGVTKDVDEAFRLFRLAADQGHAQAEFRVGEMREKGWGAPPNYAEAQRWYQKAADGGDPEAAESLAELLEEGYGTEPDVKLAAQRYRQAADKGLPEAQFRLALLTEQGRGVSHDDVAAAKLYTSAANQGYPDAQEHLGLMYLHGKGVPQDNKQAYLWFTLATKQGLKSAEHQRAEVIKKLTPDDVVALEMTAWKWRPKLEAQRNPAIIQ